MGNWVKRDVIEMITDTYQNSIRYEKKTETRYITYHTSDGEGRTTIPNNARQEQALQALKSYSQKKEQEDKKGPEWINGTWVYKGHVTTRLGTMYVNIALDINRSKQTLVCVDGRDVLESGKYKVYNGEIHCNSTYYELDKLNHRIGFGDGIYLYKK